MEDYSPAKFSITFSAELFQPFRNFLLSQSYNKLQRSVEIVLKYVSWEHVRKMQKAIIYDSASGFIFYGSVRREVLIRGALYLQCTRGRNNFVLLLKRFSAWTQAYIFPLFRIFHCFWRQKPFATAAIKFSRNISRLMKKLWYSVLKLLV